jgi:hypothetical protein
VSTIDVILQRTIDVVNVVDVDRHDVSNDTTARAVTTQECTEETEQY